MVWAIIIIFIFAIIMGAFVFALRYSRYKKFGDYRRSGSPVTNNDLTYDGEELEEKFVLKYSPLWRFALLFLAIASVALIIAYLALGIDDSWYDLLYLIIFTLLAAASVITFVFWSKWKVEANADGLVYTNYFGRKSEYAFNDLQFKMGAYGWRYSFYKDGKKVLSVSWFVTNEDKLQKAYAKYLQQKAYAKYLQQKAYAKYLQQKGN